MIIAGGGTGGHVYCGLALAEEWVASAGHEVLFVGTQRGMEYSLVPNHGYKLETISVVGLKGKGFIDKIKSLFVLPKALFQSIAIIRKFKPDVVVGIGGYASGPTVLAAWLLGLPTAITDQNSVPGATNRILGKVARRIFLTFDDAASYFKLEKVRVYGNPVIKARRQQLPYNSANKTLVVCGGSQGAKAVNDLVLQALPLLFKQLPSLKLIHQTGGTDFERIKGQVEELIKNQNLKRDSLVIAPYFDSMDEIYKQAGLIVSRAGAGTLTELALWGFLHS